MYESDLPHVNAEPRTSQTDQVWNAEHSDGEEGGDDGLVHDDESGIGFAFCVPVAECLDHYYNIIKNITFGNENESFYDCLDG